MAGHGNRLRGGFQTRTGTPAEEFFRLVKGDRRLAHEFLFNHRRPLPTAEPHNLVIDLLWSAHEKVGCFGYRGLGKSTIAEEWIALSACEMTFTNCVIVGSNEARAVERLAAIKRELEMNEALLAVYGEQKNEPWTQTKIVTARSICIQAMGRDQDVRGIKFIDTRPDLVLLDDFESRETLVTPEAQRRTLIWFYKDFLPACTPQTKVRVLATPDEHGVPMKLKEAGWPWLVIPIARIGADGAEEATWPERFSLEWIEQTRREYIALGLRAQWQAEFMCDTVSDEDSGFQAGMIRVEPRRHTYQAVFAMVDPARTTNRDSSAMTGIVVWSWIGNELVVWDDLSGYYKPSEIIDKIFSLDERYRPVMIGVEKDGLEEFLMEPLRAEQKKRGQYIPVIGMRAPKGKREFISGLQPFFAAREVVFAKELPILKQHILNFPGGRIDAINALAYAVPLRPGLPVYDGFVPALHIEQQAVLPPGEPLWLALGAEDGLVTGVLLAFPAARIAILRDFVVEGDAFAAVPEIVRAASMETRSYLRILAAPEHFDEWNNKGLAQAVRALPAELRQGALPRKGREILRRELAHVSRGLPMVRVGSEARRVLNALAAGFALPHGSFDPVKGLYRTMMEAVESAVGLLGSAQIDDSNVPWSYTQDGRRYRQYAQGGTRH